MGSHNNKSFRYSDLATVPNILTYLRFLLIVPFVISFLNENYVVAAVCIAFSGISDCLDGFLARKLNQVTDIGKILDPIADKLTLLSVVVCMAIYAPSVIPILVILIIKDLLMLAGGSNLLKKGLTPPAAKWYGKLGTIVFYISVCVIVFLKAVFSYENAVLDIIMFSFTACTMLFALYQYGKIYFSMINEYKSKEKNTEKTEK